MDDQEMRREEHEKEGLVMVDIIVEEFEEKEGIIFFF
jgi:hypothetical protein